MKINKNEITATIVPFISPLLPIFLEDINPEKNEPKIKQIEEIIGSKLRLISKNTINSDVKSIDKNVIMIPTSEESR